MATGVTWPPTPRARSVTRGSRSFSSPSERKAGFEVRPVSRDVSRISSVVASRRVQRAANVRGSIRSSFGRLAGVDRQAGVGDRLVADEGQLDLGVGQEDRVLEGVVDGRGSRRSAAPGSRTRSLVAASDGPVDALDRDRARASRRRRSARRWSTSDDGGSSWRKTAGPVATITASRTAPLAVRSRTRTASGGTGASGRLRRTSGSPRPGTIQLPVSRLDRRQVGPDLQRERLVARGQQPVAVAQARHGEVGPLRPALGRARAASAPGSAGPPAAPATANAVGTSSADEQRRAARGRPPAVPERRPVGGGQRLAGLPDGQPDHRRRDRCPAARPAGRGAGARRRPAGPSPAGSGRGSSPARGRRAATPASDGPPGRRASGTTPTRATASRTRRADRPSRNHQSRSTSTAAVATRAAAASSANSRAIWSRSRRRSRASRARRSACSSRSEPRPVISVSVAIVTVEVPGSGADSDHPEHFARDPLGGQAEDDDRVEQRGVPELIAVLQRARHLAHGDGVVELVDAREVEDLALGEPGEVGQERPVQRGSSISRRGGSTRKVVVETRTAEPASAAVAGVIRSE